ncbi:zinc-dependent alcohol dehydrogenase [Crateriforma conspicua]|uniref:D-arabitol-phosphate dehydrogenase n=1 Tax=Crateriforma conspicua TaxID=2527996 RepID=A0A5C5XT64_9PLAN|nr:alcohol dehydrogenase catalytic domain-containing protein [Crateriforma conspicua]TWT65523.1 D-arabitol-phosphate dehydrogenase [Crateriforma conspicua]
MKSAQYVGNRSIDIGDSQSIAPGPGEARLEVAYCGICGTDIHIFHGAMDQRVQMPQIIGHEVSATVAEVGPDVSDVQVGQRVAVRPLKFGQPASFDKGHAHVGKNLKFIGIDMPGGMQSSWTVPAYTLHALPDSLSMQHGAMIEPAAVACHDVRLGEVQSGETCVVIGGGPIGLLIALVAMDKGAKVILSEVNESRLALAKSLGMEAVNPMQQDLVAEVSKLTDGGMADCVFEVSGSAPGVEVMTELPNVRGRIVMVAIHPQPKPVNLFKFFWSEIRMIGARLYEEQDFDEAIRLADADKLHLDKLITEVVPIEKTQQTFEAIDANPDGIKYLIQCNA